jgi:hypothetical protein
MRYSYGFKEGGAMQPFGVGGPGRRRTVDLQRYFLISLHSFFVGYIVDRSRND